MGMINPILRPGVVCVHLYIIPGQVERRETGVIQCHLHLHSELKANLGHMSSLNNTKINKIS